MPSTSDIWMQTSNWIVESRAQLSDGPGPSLVMHSAAYGLLENFDESEAKQFADAIRRGTYREPVLRGAERTMNTRLGLEHTAVGAGVGWPELSSPEDSYQQELNGWLSRVGLPAADAIGDVVLHLQIPVLGSPPEDWKTVATLLGDSAPSPYLITCGIAAWGDRPVLALLSGATGVVIWFSQPFASTIRDHFADRLKRRLEQPDNL